MTTRTLSATQVQRNYGAVQDAVMAGQETVIVTSHGRPQVAILSITEYERLQEDARHLAVLREHGAQPVEWQ